MLAFEEAEEEALKQNLISKNITTLHKSKFYTTTAIKSCIARTTSQMQLLRQQTSCSFAEAPSPATMACGPGAASNNKPVCATSWTTSAPPQDTSKDSFFGSSCSFYFRTTMHQEDTRRAI